MDGVQQKKHFVRYKEAFLLTTNQDDYRTLLLLQGVSKYMGIAHVQLKSQIYSYLKNLLLILLLIVYFAEIVNSFSSADFDIPSTMIKLGSLTDFMFVSSSVLNAHFISRSNWGLLYDSFREIEQIMEQLQFSSPTMTWDLSVRILPLWAGFISICSYQICSWNASDDVLVDEFYVSYAWIITTTLITVFATYVLVTTSFLKSRFDFVEARIRFLGRVDLECVEAEIKYFTLFLKTAYRVVRRINSVLGLQLFSFSNTTVISLEALYCYELYGDDDWAVKLSSICNVIPQMVVLVIIVMSCDAVEQSGKKVIQACYDLHHKTTGDERLKSRILMLAIYAEEWRPIFSAAGFYDVNQKCLNSIFSASINYLVIIIQFNMMVSTEK